MPSLSWSVRPESFYSPRSIDEPARLERAMAVLNELALEREETNGVTVARAELERVHSAAYLDGLEQSSLSGGWLDPELFLDRPVWQAAKASAAALLEASRRTLADGRTRLCLSRPGSHHAEPELALGHCLLNNLAVAAADALAQGLSVCVLDFDAHHGNGTQRAFWDEPAVLTVSLHQFPFFPGSGAAEERGGPAALGFDLNLPLAAGAGGAAFRERYDEALQAVRAFAPDLVLVEAGLDGHQADWTSDLALTNADFHYVGLGLSAIAAPLVLELGGGYSEAAVRGGLEGLLGGLLGREPPAEEVAVASSAPARVEASLAAVSALRLKGLSLGETYPFAASLGAFLAADEALAALEASFAAQAPPPGQARDLAFLRFVEASDATLVDARLEAFLASAPRFRCELANTLSWYLEESQES